MVLKGSNERGHLCLVPHLSRTVSRFSLLSIMCEEPACQCRRQEMQV